MTTFKTPVAIPSKYLNPRIRARTWFPSLYFFSSFLISSSAISDIYKQQFQGSFSFHHGRVKHNFYWNAVEHSDFYWKSSASLKPVMTLHTLTKAGVGSGIDGTSSNSPDPLSTLTTFEFSYISPILTCCTTKSTHQSPTWNTWLLT